MQIVRAGFDEHFLQMANIQTNNDFIISIIYFTKSYKAYHFEITVPQFPIEKVSQMLDIF